MEKKISKKSGEHLLLNLHLLEQDANRYREAISALSGYLTPGFLDKIKTPLSSLLGFSKLLLREDTDDQVKQLYVEYLESSCRNLSRSVDDLVDTVLFSLNRVSLESRIFRLEELFREEFAQLKHSRRIMERYSVGLFCNISGEDRDLLAFGDDVRLGQVINRMSEYLLSRTEKGIVEIGFHRMNGKDIHFYTRSSRIQAAHKILQQMKNRESHSIIFPEQLLAETITTMMGGILRMEPYEEEGVSFSFRLPIAVNERKIVQQNTSGIQKNNSIE